MKLPVILTKKKKLRAATARQMEYEEMSEPNMNLSRALLIVLLLHIVAVAGIVAFNTIKTRENLAAAPAPSATPAAIVPNLAPPTPAAAEAAPAVATTPNEMIKTSAAAVTKPSVASTKPAASPAATAAASSVKDSGKIYTVVRGDNPVTIARRHHVSEADLLELNQISDPRKLQINQKLHIPEAHAK